MWRPEGQRPIENLDVDGKIIIKCIFRKWGREEWTGLLCLTTERVGGLL
jgi:hypothetical protein